MKRALLLLPAALLAAGSLCAQSLTVTVTVHNDLPFARPSETVVLTAAQLAPLGGDLTKVHVYEGGSTREVLAQVLDGTLLFQADVPARGQRVFDLKPGDKRVYKREDFRVYGRFNRERFDDFAWENDRVAHRMYGAALETWEKEPLTSSTVDVWLKRTRRLVLNDWYLADDYHRDNGEGADFYSAGRSRGCGGSGLWRDGKLVVSKNFRESRVLANGPIRLVFELVLPRLQGDQAHHVGCGQNFNRFESRYENVRRHDVRRGHQEGPGRAVPRRARRHPQLGARRAERGGVRLRGDRRSGVGCGDRRGRGKSAHRRSHPGGVLGRLRLEPQRRLRRGRGLRSGHRSVG